MALNNNWLAQVKTDLGPVTLTPKGFTEPFNNPATRLEQIFSSIISVFTIFAGLAFLFYFAVGAVTWIISAGDNDRLNRAKSQMSTALVGLFITVIGTAIVYVLGRVTGLDILNPAGIIKNLKPR